MVACPQAQSEGTESAPDGGKGQKSLLNRLDEQLAIYLLFRSRSLFVRNEVAQLCFAFVANGHFQTGASNRVRKPTCFLRDRMSNNSIASTRLAESTCKLAARPINRNDPRYALPRYKSSATSSSGRVAVRLSRLNSIIGKPGKPRWTQIKARVESSVVRGSPNRVLLRCHYIQRVK